jgi:hypothetical protein
VVLVLKFLALAVSVAGAHLFDGLAFAALIFGMLIGWLGVRFYWLAVPALGLANLAGMFYAHSTGAGKSASALGNFPMELFVFSGMLLLAYGVGLWVRHVQFSRVDAKMRRDANM